MDNLSNLPVNVLDIAVIAVLLVSAIFAYARGFVHEVLAVGGWVGAILITIYSFPYVKPYARKLIAIDLVADLAGGTVVFIVTLVFLSILTKAISKRVQASSLNALDRSLGFLFGLARGALVICAGYLLLEFVMPKAQQPDWVRNARSMQLIEPGAHMLTRLIPIDAAKRLGSAASDAGTRARSAANGVINDAVNSAVEHEKKRLVDGLLSPTPKADTGQTDTPAGYGERPRQQLERLIDGAKAPQQ